jgi:CRP/FNR family transcriptional regulator, cyclic AMP receptor protein
MGENDRLWYLEHYDPFKNLKEKEILEIESNILRRFYKKHSILHFPKMLDKYVYFLKEGIIKIAVTNKDGREFIKYLLKQGNLFGTIPLLGGAESQEDYAVTLEDSCVCFIDSAKLKQWMEENDDLRTKIYKQIGSRIHKVENRLVSMIFKNARTRIQEFIIDFVTEFGSVTENGYEIKNILTHDDIAKLTATSRQTVSSVLSRLRNKKWLEYNNRYIKIPFSSKLLTGEKNDLLV